jgi:geranylgeranyl pyrophosphate synthase
MRYAASGGKRVRGLFFLSIIAALGEEGAPFLPFAAGIECIHAYSLVHDDLPAMDDDDLRRGRPTCHRVFGEAQAILAGDGLLSEGLRLLLAEEVVAVAGAERSVRAFRALARGIGAEGMVYGQSLDMLGEDGAAPVEEIHRKKTAAFFAGIARAAGELAAWDAEQLERLGEAYGLAFQIADDLLDRRATTAQLGKTAGKDVAQQKRTFVSVHGEGEAEAELRRWILAAEAEARCLPQPKSLLELLSWSLTRSH